MIFNAPQIWWAIGALAIPIIVHLFLFRRSKKIYFSNVSLISQIKDETKSRSRLEHLLVLISRLLIFAFLILAFMQPTGKESGNTFSKSVIYIDNSYSLSNEVNSGISSLDAVLTAVSSYVREKPLDHQFVIITNDFAPFSNHFKSRNEALDYLTEVGFSPVSRSMEAVLRRFRAFDISKTSYHVYSDFQKSSFNLESQAAFDGDVHLHSFKSQALGNIYVDSVYLENPFVNLGASNAIVFSIANTGNPSAKEATFRLLSGNKLIGTRRLSVPGNGSVELAFDIDFKTLDGAALNLTFEDYPVIFDNQFLLTVPKYEKIKVGLISDLERSYIERIYGNKELFELDILTSRSVDFTALSKYDVLFLEALESLPSWLPSTQADVVVIPPAGTLDLSSYRDFFKVSLDLAEEEILRTLTIRNADHPFYRDLLEEMPENLSMPKGKIRLSMAPTTNTLLANELGEPFLTRFNQSRNVYLFTAPLTTAYTGLPEHAIFLPVMYKIAQESLDGIGLVAHRFDEKLLQISVSSQSRAAVTISNEDISLVPNHYFQGDRLVVELPPEGITNAFYQLRQEADTVALLAFNMPRSESMLEAYEVDELEDFRSILPNMKVSDYESLYALEADVKAFNATPYWKYALVLALIFVLFEAILLRAGRARR